MLYLLCLIGTFEIRVSQVRTFSGRPLLGFQIWLEGESKGHEMCAFPKVIKEHLDGPNVLCVRES